MSRTYRRRRRPQLDRPTRLAIYARDRFRCLYCEARFRDIPVQDRTQDHLIPFSHGGPTVPANLVTACLSCNNARNRQPYELFATAEALWRIERAVGTAIEAYLHLMPSPVMRKR